MSNSPALMLVLAAVGLALASVLVAGILRRDRTASALIKTRSSNSIRATWLIGAAAAALSVIAIGLSTAALGGFVGGSSPDGSPARNSGGLPAGPSGSATTSPADSLVTVIAPANNTPVSDVFHVEGIVSGPASNRTLWAVLKGTGFTDTFYPSDGPCLIQTLTPGNESAEFDCGPMSLDEIVDVGEVVRVFVVIADAQASAQFEAYNAGTEADRSSPGLPILPPTVTIAAEVRVIRG